MSGDNQSKRNETTGVLPLDRIIELTGGTEEICLYFYPEHISRYAGPWGPEEREAACWIVGAINPSLSVAIGEVRAEFEAEGATLDEALNLLADKLSK